MKFFYHLYLHLSQVQVVGTTELAKPRALPVEMAEWLAAASKANAAVAYVSILGVGWFSLEFVTVQCMMMMMMMMMVMMMMVTLKFVLCSVMIEKQPVTHDHTHTHRVQTLELYENLHHSASTKMPIVSYNDDLAKIIWCILPNHPFVAAVKTTRVFSLPTSSYFGGQIRLVQIEDGHEVRVDNVKCPEFASHVAAASKFRVHTLVFFYRRGSEVRDWYFSLKNNGKSTWKWMLGICWNTVLVSFWGV